MAARGARLDGSGNGRRARPFRLWVTIGWLLVLAAAFGVGYLLARHDASVAVARIQALQTEAASLSQQLAAAKEAHVRLERAHLIDREAKRVAQGQLADLQRERLQLAKRVAYLQRLINADGAGIIEVKDVSLEPGERPGHYRYRLTLSQLAPNFGRSAGTVTVSVAMAVGDKEQVRSLDELPGSSPARLAMGFDYFQTLDGDIVLPVDAQPRHLIVDISPSTRGLLRSSDVFLWPGVKGTDELLAPVVEPQDDDAQAGGA